MSRTEGHEIQHHTHHHAHDHGHHARQEAYSHRSTGSQSQHSESATAHLPVLKLSDSEKDSQGRRTVFKNADGSEVKVSYEGAGNSKLNAYQVVDAHGNVQEQAYLTSSGKWKDEYRDSNSNNLVKNTDVDMKDVSVDGNAIHRKEADSTDHTIQLNNNMRKNYDKYGRLNAISNDTGICHLEYGASGSHHATRYRQMDHFGNTTEIATEKSPGVWDVARPVPPQKSINNHVDLDNASHETVSNCYLDTKTGKLQPQARGLDTEAPSDNTPSLGDTATSAVKKTLWDDLLYGPVIGPVKALYDTVNDA